MTAHHKTETQDVVCGMTVDPDSTECYVDYEGTRYYFCSESCREEFQGHPDKYLKHRGKIGAFLDRLASSAEEEFGPDRPLSHEKILKESGPKD